MSSPADGLSFGLFIGVATAEALGALRERQKHTARPRGAGAPKVSSFDERPLSRPLGRGTDAGRGAVHLENPRFPGRGPTLGVRPIGLADLSRTAECYETCASPG